MFEGTLAENKFISEATKCPPVDGDGLATFVDQFGCIILGGAANAIGCRVTLHVELTLAEVDQFNLAVCAHHHIFGFEVALDYSFLV